MNRVFSILFLVLLLAACDSQDARLQKAQNCYQQGLELRGRKLSEEAAQSFLEGLEILRRCEKTPETLLLEGRLYDNLGAMYHKHSLFDDALAMHQEAIRDFKAVNDSTGLVTAYRNCGRVTNLLEQFSLSKHYYDTAFQIATFINEAGMLADLHLEMARDYYLPVGHYAKAIDCVNKALEGPLSDNDLDIAHMTLGVLYYYTDDYSKAKTFLNEALRSERAGLKMTVYQTLYAIAYNEGDFTQALEYQDLFTQYMMQSDKEHNSEVIQRIKAEYELKAQKSE